MSPLGTRVLRGRPLAVGILTRTLRGRGIEVLEAHELPIHRNDVASVAPSSGY